MKITKRITAAALALLLCISAAGCASGSDATEKVDTLRYNDVSYSSDVKESGVVYEDDTWQLTWDNQNKRVSFVEKATGNIWGTTPQEAVDSAKQNHAQVESAIHVYYHNPTNVAEEMSMSYSEAVRGGEVYAQRIDNGLRVIYDFMSYEIAVPVDYTVQGGQFSVTVNPTEIADNGVNYVTAVSLAPFMCALPNEMSDSWLFMPDGSGTLIYPDVLSAVGQSGMSHVYGDDLTVQVNEFNSVKEQNYMPVFGVKKGDAGLLGIIESGDEAASIAWNVGSSNVGYSSVYAQFTIRGYSSVTPPRGFATPASYIKVFADYISPTPLRVTYYALSGEKAGLQGMADTYREYLLKNGQLKQSKAEEKSVAFKYVGAAEQPDFFVGLPTTKLFPLTTTEQAAKMTYELADSLGDDFYVDLVGFGPSGVDIGKYAGGFTVAKELGGAKGMASLSATMEKLNLPWYMDFDLLTLTKGSSGISQGADSARWINQQIAYFHTFNTVSRMTRPERYYFLARNKLSEVGQLLLDKTANLKLKGVSLDSLSHTVYSDYTDASTQVVKGIAEDVTGVISTVQEGGYTFLADAANVYAAGIADAVIDAPLYSSRHDFNDEDVPFYEMVLRGYIPMNSVSINLCADEKDALLRCVEAGIAPSYTLTYNYDNELVTSQHAFIYGSSYSGNNKRIIEQVGTVKDYLTSIEGTKITNHVLLGKDVRMTAFDNGVYAIVNFGNADAETAYGVVPAGSWITGRDAQ